MKNYYCQINNYKSITNCSDSITIIEDKRRFMVETSIEILCITINYPDCNRKNSRVFPLYSMFHSHMRHYLIMIRYFTYLNFKNMIKIHAVKQQRTEPPGQATPIRHHPDYQNNTYRQHRISTRATSVKHAAEIKTHHHHLRGPH